MSDAALRELIESQRIIMNALAVILDAAPIDDHPDAPRLIAVLREKAKDLEGIRVGE